MIKGIIGDIIGSVHEGYQWTIKDQDILNLQAERIPVIKDAFNKRTEQTITDDSICTLGLLEAYMYNKNGVEAAQVLADFCKKHRECGFGKNFEKWIDNPVPYDSFANGCLMRLGFLDYIRKEDRLSYAIDYTLISHNHIDSISSVEDYILILNRENDSFLEEISIRRNITKTVEDYHNEKRFEISAKGTLDQAIVVLKESKSFIEILQNCMYIGGDTDTLATIACNLSKFIAPDFLITLATEEIKRIDEINKIKNIKIIAY